MSAEPKILTLRVEIVDEGRPAFMVMDDTLTAVRAKGLRAVSVCGWSDKSERQAYAERNEVSGYARSLEARLRQHAAELRAIKAKWDANGALPPLIADDMGDLADEIEEGLRAPV